MISLTRQHFKAKSITTGTQDYHFQQLEINTLHLSATKLLTNNYRYVHGKSTGNWFNPAVLPNNWSVHFIYYNFSFIVKWKKCNGQYMEVIVLWDSETIFKVMKNSKIVDEIKNDIRKNKIWHKFPKDEGSLWKVSRHSVWCSTVF